MLSFGLYRKKDFGDRIFVSNSYSILRNDNNKWYINYEIKIFELMVQSFDINHFLGKSMNIELIDYSTTQQSNYDNDTLNGLNILLNTTGISLIKCKIINSYINLQIDEDLSYDKEILILCLYYSKDLDNSLPNEPKFSIRLDLFKNVLGDNELNLISYITIKNSISIDKEDNERINYLYPEMITFKDNEGEIYVVLKGVKYTEIYITHLNIETLSLSNSRLNLSKSYNNALVSFTPREFIGSFYIGECNKEENKLKIYIYGDRKKNNYLDTKVELNSICDGDSKIEITSISNYLLAFLVDNKIVFVLFPMCDPLNKIYQLSSDSTKDVPGVSLTSDPLFLQKYSNIFAYQNSIIDDLSCGESATSTLIFVDFDENYLTSEEKNEHVIIAYGGDHEKIIINTKSHIENLKVSYNLYFKTDDNNKFYSPTCSFLINICHPFCKKCLDFSTQDDDPKCIECLAPNYYPLASESSKCKSINEIPFPNYYFAENDKKFKPCDESCQ